MKPKVHLDVLVQIGNNLKISLLGLGRDLPFFNIQTIQVVFSDSAST